MYNKIYFVCGLVVVLIILVSLSQYFLLKEALSFKVEEFQKESEQVLGETTKVILDQILMYELIDSNKVSASLGQDGKSIFFRINDECKIIPLAKSSDFNQTLRLVIYDLAMERKKLDANRISEIYSRKLQEKGIDDVPKLMIQDAVTHKVIFSTTSDLDTSEMVMVKPIPIGYDKHHLLKAGFSYPYKLLFKRLFNFLMAELIFILIFILNLYFLTKTIIVNWRTAKIKSEGVGHWEHETRKTLGVLCMGIKNVIEKGQGIFSVEIKEELLHIKNRLVKLNTVMETMLLTFKHGYLVVDRAKIDVERDIMDVIEIFRDLKPYAVITTEIKPNMGEVYLDMTYFSFLVSNLIDNAIKYTEKRPEILVKCYTEDNRLILIVKDNGIGISTYHQRRLFRKFYRVDNKQMVRNISGFGLGLAFVKQVTDAYHGKIEVKSALGKGSEFTITLPC